MTWLRFAWFVVRHPRGAFAILRCCVLLAKLGYDVARGEDDAERPPAVEAPPV